MLKPSQDFNQYWVSHLRRLGEVERQKEKSHLSLSKLYATSMKCSRLYKKITTDWTNKDQDF